jgi:hypothetical protein
VPAALSMPGWILGLRVPAALSMPGWILGFIK